MPKILLVGSKEQRVVCLALEKVVSTLAGSECDIATHDEALATFLSGDYSHVVIVDYSEKLDLERGGFASFRDISASATGQKIIRCGLENLPYADYIAMPCLVPELLKKLTE